MAPDLSTYPPKGHQERMAAYQRYERLFLGQHKLVFAVVPQPHQVKSYIVAPRLPPGSAPAQVCLSPSRRRALAPQPLCNIVQRHIYRGHHEQGEQGRGGETAYHRGGHGRLHF